MIEVKTSDVLNKMMEKEAFNAGDALKGLAKNQRAAGAAIGAGTGAVAGAVSGDDAGKGALTGGLIGAAGGAIGGSLAQKNTTKAVSKATTKGFATGLGVGTVGGATGAKLAGKTLHGAKGVASGGKVVDTAADIGAALKDGGNGISGKIKGGIDWVGENTDKLKGYADRVTNLFKTSSEYRGEFGVAIFEKVANEQYTFGQAIAELVNGQMDKMAQEEMPVETYVEKMATSILDDFSERLEKTASTIRVIHKVKRRPLISNDAAFTAAMLGIPAAVVGTNIYGAARAYKNVDKQESQGKNALMGTYLGTLAGQPGIGAWIGSGVGKKNNARMKELEEKAKVREIREGR